ncbi:hypothetical protein ABOM_001522 [Aspergillus bombycis]|uniref:Antigenic cell wall galactomannoprotein n=1 Tax=Aspergillus bombycis TaxID=109264 RepID=A0A1F8ADU8_9EURO|nr:hypothetical protein ABOM_001522 [Aspergillus bombycis]OGM49894.1 hypothetical protein ABOM_001522 [Aspergillus bombycis]
MYPTIPYVALFLFAFQVYRSNPPQESSNPVLRASLDLGSIFEDIFRSHIPEGTTNSTLKNVGNAIDGLVGLFSPTLMKDVVSSVTHMADLFDNETSVRTKSIIQLGADQLTNDTINAVTSLLDNANVLLTADNVASVNNLLEQASPRLTEVFNEINNPPHRRFAVDLLSTDVVNNIGPIVNATAPVLSTELVDKLQTTLNKRW